MLGNTAPPAMPAPTAPAPDPYTTSVMSYADKVKALLSQRAAPVEAAPAGPPAGPPVTGMLPGQSPENPTEDNMTINARSGEYVFPEPAVKYYGVKKLEDMVHKAIEDINPPGQPAPEPPTQAQTFAKGGLINRKHFMRVPKGHAYDKMSPKKHPLKQPVGLPPMAPDAMPMDPAAMQVAPQQIGPPAQPTQPPLPSYWGGGLIWNNPDYWSGRDRADRFGDLFEGPQVITHPAWQPWNPNQFPPDLPPDRTQNPVHQATPPRKQRYMGGMVGPVGSYAGGGEVGDGSPSRDYWIYGHGGGPMNERGIDPSGFNPDNANILTRFPNMNPPGFSFSGPTRLPTTWSWQGPNFGWTAQGLNPTTDRPLSLSRHTPPKLRS